MLRFLAGCGAVVLSGCVGFDCCEPVQVPVTVSAPSIEPIVSKPLVSDPVLSKPVETSSPVVEVVPKVSK